MTENSKFVEYSTPSNIRSFFYFVTKKIRRIFEAVEYSKIFSFCGKKKSSNIRSHRIFDEFRAHERRSNIRRLYSKNIWIQKLTQKIHIRSYSTNFLRISKFEYESNKFVEYILSLIQKVLIRYPFVSYKTNPFLLW